ncbi:plasmid pRiA4b ORF-3 family protein [Actinomadura viridis]|uniref:plasmid pRiA4b ORF-3 family protein n=1 Tax=Actinomadura viridis TaxID=58110 RepID=UPI00367C0DB5
MPNRAVADVADLSPERLVSQARACPALATARTLAEWVGAGREVTARGVLRPATVVEACDLLGIEVPTRKPRSALDVDELMMVWETASAAGFIEVTGGRVTAGPGLRQWLEGAPEDVLAVWTACAAWSLGLVGEAEPEDLDYLTVLATLYERGGAASWAELSAAINELEGGAPSSCECPDCTARGGAPGAFTGLLVDLGPDEAEAEDVVRVLDQFGIAEVRGEGAELTPLGLWFTDLLFRANAPAADADAAVLVDALTGLPDRVARLMARSWLSARTPAEAAGELLAAGEATSGQERLDALALARGCGPEGAPAWREWAARDGFGAYARVWLAEQDGTEPAEADQAWVTVDTLTVLLDALPADMPAELLPAMLPALLGSGAGAELAGVLPLLEKCGHPDGTRLAGLLGGVPESGPATTPAPFPFPVPAPREGGSGAAYQIKIQLRGVTKPPVWRRLLVPADIGLDRLHEVIQAAMGWENHHMHVFSHGSGEYGLPDRELGHRDERKVMLSQLLTLAGDGIGYTYDFGDGWEHDIVLEEALTPGTEVAVPVCTAGKGACPPEDCGGVWGYEGLKDTLADPDAEDHDDMLEWLGLDSGDDFDPKAFSLAEVNRRLRR